MILSILATVAVLAAIAVIAAALVFAETALVYIALGLGALSVLLLLGALLQGRFGAGGKDTTRTDGLGKSSVPAVPTAVPGPTWESEQPGRVPAPALESVRDTPVPEQRPWGEEPQEEPEFDVPRWETPTKGDWPEPVQAAQTPPPPSQDELVEAPVSEFAYRIPERDPATPVTEDDTVEAADAMSEAGPDDTESEAALGGDEDFASYETPEDVDADEPEAAEETIGASAAFTDLDPVPEAEDADDDEDELTESVEDAPVEPQETFQDADPDEHSAAAVWADDDEAEAKTPESEGLEVEDTTGPEEDAPETDGDRTLEADDDASAEDHPETDESVEGEEGPDRSEAFESSEPDEDVQDATDTDEDAEAVDEDEGDPDRNAAFDRPTPSSEAVGTESDEGSTEDEDDPEPGEDPAVAYAAIFGDSVPEDDGEDKDLRDDENGLDEAEERPKDPSHTN